MQDAEPTADRATLTGRLADGLIASARPLLLFFLLLVIAAHWPASRLRLDQSVESLFPENDPVAAALRTSRAAFGGDEFAFLAYEAPDLMVPDPDEAGELIVNEDRLEEIKAFAKEVKAVPGVVPEDVQDIGHFLAPEGKVPVGVRLMTRSPTLKEKVLQFAESVLVSPDRTVVGVAARLQPEDAADVPRAETVRLLRELAAGHDPPATLVGEPVQLVDTFEYIDQDSRLLGWASLIVLSAAIALLFRKVRWVLLPILVVYSAGVLTKATLVILELRLSMVSSVLSSITTVIGVATVMHVIVHFRELRLEDEPDFHPGHDGGPLSREQALRRTLVELGPPIFWTCLTTAIGFLALLTSSILPVRSFGVMMAVATACVFLSTFAVLPGGILMGGRGVDPHAGRWDRAVASGLAGLVGHLRRHGYKWLWGTCVVMAVAAFGMTRLRIESDFTKNFREDSPIVTALEFFEDRMGGAGAWEMLLPTKTEAGQPFDADDAEELRRLSDALREVETPSGTKLTKVLSLTDGTDLIPRVALRLGRTTEKELLQEFQPDFWPSLINEEKGVMRVSLRSNERQPSEEKLALIRAVVDKARETSPRAQPTGAYIMLALLVEKLISDQWWSFVVATAAITLTMMLAFRSVRYGLISLIPNALPIVLVLGVIGWAGVNVNMGTAMIASVSVGLTVDSSIHYLAGYRRARESGLPHWDALKAVQAGTGRALVFSQLALVGGFSVLALSNFIPLVYFGVLVSVAMLVGLFADLFLLPMLLTLAEGVGEGAKHTAGVAAEPEPAAAS